MAQRLETAAQVIAAETRKRNEAILEAHRNGDSLRDIAAKVGLSWSGVRKIINNEKEAPQ